MCHENASQGNIFNKSGFHLFVGKDSCIAHFLYIRKLYESVKPADGLDILGNIFFAWKSVYRQQAHLLSSRAQDEEGEAEQEDGEVDEFGLDVAFAQDDDAVEK